MHVLTVLSLYRCPFPITVHLRRLRVSFVPAGVHSALATGQDRQHTCDPAQGKLRSWCQWWLSAQTQSPAADHLLPASPFFLGHVLWPWGPPRARSESIRVRSRAGWPCTEEHEHCGWLLWACRENGGRHPEPQVTFCQFAIQNLESASSWDYKGRVNQEVNRNRLCETLEQLF